MRSNFPLSCHFYDTHVKGYPGVIIVYHRDSGLATHGGAIDRPVVDEPSAITNNDFTHRERHVFEYVRD